MKLVTTIFQRLNEYFVTWCLRHGACHLSNFRYGVMPGATWCDVVRRGDRHLSNITPPISIPLTACYMLLSLRSDRIAIVRLS